MKCFKWHLPSGVPLGEKPSHAGIVDDHPRVFDGTDSPIVTVGAERVVVVAREVVVAVHWVVVSWS